jgi:hypothetical protein
MEVSLWGPGCGWSEGGGGGGGVIWGKWVENSNAMLHLRVAGRQVKKVEI